MPKRTPLNREDVERELHAAGLSPAEIEAGARRLLAQARGRQLAETRRQLGLGQKQIAAAMGVTVARVSQIEHGEVTSFEVIARYVEALGGRLDLVAGGGREEPPCVRALPAQGDVQSACSLRPCRSTGLGAS
jgi:ribosome-binding protein aMBF1 (putative translation factor)